MKSLVVVGSQLCNVREYRDFYEDLLTKIVEPFEELGCSRDDINSILLCSCHLIDHVSSNSNSNSNSNSSNSNSSNNNGNDGVYSREEAEGANYNTNYNTNYTHTNSDIAHSISLNSNIQSNYSTNTQSYTHYTSTEAPTPSMILHCNWVRYVTCCRLCIIHLGKNST